MANNFRQQNRSNRWASSPKKKSVLAQEQKNAENVQEKEIDSDSIEVEWIVDDVLGFSNYSVLLTDIGMKVTAYPSWKMNKNKIRIIQWDKVKVELNPFDPTKWRIVYRQK